MKRLLLASSLFLLAAAALAKPVTTCDNPEAGNSKPGKLTTATAVTTATTAVTTTADSDTPVVTHPAATSTVHSSAGHASMPRWHSLLPGMIR
jgi:hypothetical protein